MSLAVLEPVEAEETLQPMLYVVWIDSWMGIYHAGPGGTYLPCWEENDAPSPLQEALDEAAKCRALGYPTRVCPEGSTPF